MIVMIIAVSVVTGFQNEIKNKVIGFGSHIQINARAENKPIDLQQAYFYPGLEKRPEIEHIQMYATKPGIIQNAGDTVWFTDEDGNRDFRINRDIAGVICKGVGPDHDWSFIKSKMVEGELPDFSLSESSSSRDILVSKSLADQLKLEVGNKLNIYFLKDTSASFKNFLISGIYETGFEEYDGQLVFVDLRHVQNLNGWGVSVYLELLPVCKDGQFYLQAQCSRGSSKNYRFDRGKGYQVGKIENSSQYEFMICPGKDSTYQVIGADFGLMEPGFERSQGYEPAPYYVPDTAWLHVSTEIMSDTLPACFCPLDSGEQIWSDQSEDGSVQVFTFPHLKITTTFSSSGGSQKHYVTGFEVTTKDWDELKSNVQLVKEETGSVGHNTYAVASIKELKAEIFGWLDMLDMNVVIILVLTIFVAVINMSSALLVLILERTNLIGILKAMGSANWSIRKIFLYNAAYLIGKGMIWGNVIGIGLCLLQQEFGLIQLDQETYYTSTVPINLNLIHILLLNVGTITLCTLAMIIPSYLVTRISPVKAIKFN